MNHKFNVSSKAVKKMPEHYRTIKFGKEKDRFGRYHEAVLGEFNGRLSWFDVHNGEYLGDEIAPQKETSMSQLNAHGETPEEQAAREQREQEKADRIRQIEVLVAKQIQMNLQEFLCQFVKCISNQQKLQAIKMYRSLTGLGLKESKDDVEAIMVNLPKQLVSEDLALKQNYEQSQHRCSQLIEENDSLRAQVQKLEEVEAIGQKINAVLTLEREKTAAYRIVLKDTIR